jgi:hypothetical protein
VADGAPRPRAALTEDRAELLRQRDEARAARDRAKQERDEARRQRDAARDAPTQPGFATLDAFAREAERALLRPALLARQAAGEALRAQELEMVVPRFRPALLNRPASLAPPPAGVVLVTVANAAFLPGLEALLLSLRQTYPGLSNPFHVFADASLDAVAGRWLRRLYPGLQLHRLPLDGFTQVPAQSANQRRIGPIAYLGSEAMGLVEAERVLLLDADLLVTGGLAPLWQGQGVIACADCGEREFGVVSPTTGGPVVNSGVLSLPRAMLGSAAKARWLQLAHGGTPPCPVLDRFADQRVWNHFLRDQPVTLAAVNFNCNAKLAARSLGGRLEAISVLHFTGAKPWLKPETEQTAVDRWWSDAARGLLWRHRAEAYAAWAPARRAAPWPEGPAATEAWVQAGPGVTPPPDAAVFRAASQLEGTGPVPQHVVLDVETGAGPARLPAGWAERLWALRPRPMLWAPFRLREALEEANAQNAFDINYLLLEQPFAPDLDQSGQWPGPDGFQPEGPSVFLGLACAAAQAMGYRRVTLAGLPGDSSERFRFALSVLQDELALHEISLTLS